VQVLEQVQRRSRLVIPAVLKEALLRSLSVLDPVDEAATCRFTLAATLV
jgi:hypothetical protein